MGIEQIKLGCRVHEQLINSAVALAPTPNFRDLTLTDIANAYGITQEEAHKCFANVDELVDAVREFLSGIFYKNVPVPTASDFPGAVTELIISYTRCARSNPQLFRAMYSLMPAEPELSHDNPNPVLAMAMRVVNHFYPEASEWVRLTRSIAIFSCMHGYTHLCTFGSLRHLSTPAKDHVAAALARHVIVGIGDSLSTGRALRVAPFDFYEHIPAESFPAAKDMPKTTEEERFIALHRGAIEVIAYQDPSALTVEAAAARSGVKLKEARAMLDPEIPEPQQLEKYLDEWGGQAVQSLHV